MVSFQHTILVNDPDVPAQPTLDATTLWDILVHKAANPVPYVPSITSARVLERADNEFVREIVLRDTATVREQVTLIPRRRIVFTQLDNLDLTTITNEIGEDEQGRVTFTFTATLSAAGIERSRRESGFVAENDLLFYDTARATVNSARLYAAIPPGNRASENGMKGIRVTGRVVHFELPADDVARASKFYTDAFGWNLTPLPGQRSALAGTTATGENGQPTDPGAINGGIASRGGAITNPLVTLDVPDIEAAFTKIEELGGKRVQERVAVGDMGFVAYFADPEGNVVGLWQNAG
ncbi:MAG TPA: AtaL-like protein [Pseudonocardiaceae bacterium]|nr:AtaL-like protein [Pseudonocardiaceae bacterium]